jgi:hypothetical protein
MVNLEPTILTYVSGIVTVRLEIVQNGEVPPFILH